MPSIFAETGLKGARQCSLDFSRFQSNIDAGSGHNIDDLLRLQRT
jgi:hypothetical protein